jgi:hypothetical protein
MPVLDRIRSLEKKHRFLEEAIHREIGRPLPDLFFLKDLKIRKLRVREQIDKLIQR